HLPSAVAWPGCCTRYLCGICAGQERQGLASIKLIGLLLGSKTKECRSPWALHPVSWRVFRVFYTMERLVISPSDSIDEERVVTDAELVARLKDNDDEAYCEVVARYGDPLYGYIYHLTGDPHLSEDVLSETYLRMVEKIDTYTFYGPRFQGWLYRIA